MITLKNSSYRESTVLSNLFIDRYMPEANGEFVKVYIYLVRTISDAPVSFSLEQMADHLLCTEGDILRALKYWAKLGVLSLIFDSEKKLSDIELQTLEPASSKISQPVSEPAVSGVETEASVSAVPKQTTSSLTPGRILELKKNEEIAQLLYAAEQYLGKTLTSTEMQKILYFYDELKMSSALIEFLIEYCVGRNHRSIRYMEKVALAWSQEGIHTVEEAKAATSLYGKDYFTILKYLGITNRSPVADEVTYMDTWMKTYGFSLDIIQEACSRTILRTGQPRFDYTEGTLKSWHNQNVHSLKDIQELDKQHKKTRSSSPKPKQTPAPAANRFNNIPQHDYDYDEIERTLLNR